MSQVIRILEKPREVIECPRQSFAAFESGESNRRQWQRLLKQTHILSDRIVKESSCGSRLNQPQAIGERRSIRQSLFFDSWHRFGWKQDSMERSYHRGSIGVSEGGTRESTGSDERCF